MGGAWDSAWEAALDELELTLAETERLLAGEDPATVPVAPWTPPQLDSPLPAEMVARATSLLGRQQNLAERTARAMSDTRHAMAYVARVADASGTRQPARPVYLDIRA